jgi:hypothetical protein
MHTKMKPIVLAILGAAAVLLLFSCDDKKNKDLTQTINKEGSIETAVQVEHLDSTHDVLVTSHKIWAQNREIKTVQYRDTVPSLGMTNTEAENAEGDKKTVRVKKDYEIFITIK